MSYVVAVFDGCCLVNGYWGHALENPRLEQLITLGTRPYTVSVPLSQDFADSHYKQWIRKDAAADTGALSTDPSYSPEGLPLEYPIDGMGDLRETAFRMVTPGGSSGHSFVYHGYELIRGIPGPDGLPYVTPPELSWETLRIDLKDAISQVKLELYYLPIPDLSVILRWTRVCNESDLPVEIDQIASASVDLHIEDAELITLDGAWGKERHFHRRAVGFGVQGLGSRGGASGHQHAPFIAIADAETTEDYGDVYGATLIYSGNHRHAVERNQYGFYRMQGGINPDGFRYGIEPGGYFDSPAAVLAWSDSGLTGISDTLHGFVRRYLLPKTWRDRDRPVIVNTWEAHYWDVNSDKVLELAKKGKEIGGEVLVLDDGWFKNRRDDKRALGDWVPDEKKFPGGLLPTVEKIRKLGLEFGLWVEPEMVNPESELFRRHPDWVLKAPGRDPVLARNQLVLNLAKCEVVDYLLDLFSGIFSSVPIAYVKWDMNRSIVETANPEEPHRYMLGLYRFWGTLNHRFPHILFEGCAGGGGRYDFGSLAYMPQFWASDQTDAVERQRIQFGSSLLFPPETMGAHVSAVPNHQVGRKTPALTRILTSLGFNYGYELDLSLETPEDKSVFRRFSQIYKDNRSMFRTGRFLRLLPRQEAFRASRIHPSEKHAWSVVSPQQDRAMIFYFQTLAEPNDEGCWLRVKGLRPNATYRETTGGIEYESGLLMNRGLWIPPSKGDYRSVYWNLEVLL